MVNAIFRQLVQLQILLNTLFWGLLLKRKGKNLQIRDNVIIMSPNKVEMGDNVFINTGTVIGGQCGVKIGNDVLMGYNVNIVSENHEYRNKSIPIRKQGYYGAPIVIEDDVWIASNAVILPGLVVGKGSVVAANAVVTKDVPSYSVVGGVPAKVIKKRA